MCDRHSHGPWAGETSREILLARQSNIVKGWHGSLIMMLERQMAARRMELVGLGSCRPHLPGGPPGRAAGFRGCYARGW